MDDKKDILILMRYLLEWLHTRGIVAGLRTAKVEAYYTVLYTGCKVLFCIILCGNILSSVDKYV